MMRSTHSMSVRDRIPVPTSIRIRWGWPMIFTNARATR